MMGMMRQLLSVMVHDEITSRVLVWLRVLVHARETMSGTLT